ncbi:MAG TPA: hypothetical protein VFV10_06025 [Gammaproteobacteria bacterium]|nr:hypothetical protein [Gammaproteobacteria bacterium]
MSPIHRAAAVVWSISMPRVRLIPKRLGARLGSPDVGREDRLARISRARLSPLGSILVPSGRVNSKPPSAVARGPSLFGINRAHGIEIEHRTAAARWMGDKLDYGWAVEDLIYRRDRARRQAAY